MYTKSLILIGPYSLYIRVFIGAIYIQTSNLFFSLDRRTMHHRARYTYAAGHGWRIGKVIVVMMESIWQRTDGSENFKIGLLHSMDYAVLP